MPIPPHGPIPLDERSRDAAAVRDAGVRRVRRTTRWLIVGAVGLTGAIAGVAAQQTLPADASQSGAASAASGYASNDTGRYDDGGGYADDGGYGEDDGGYAATPQAPAQAPQSAPQAAPSTSSGAS